MLEVKNINKKFNDRLILDNISLSVKNKDYICAVGKSGCGKTTFLNIIAGMMEPSEGEVVLNNVNIYKDLKENKRTLLRGGEIGYLNYGNCLLENLTVYENIKYTLLLNKLPFNKEDVKNILKKLEIFNVRNSYPAQISAGEYRRVCFGRILAMNPKLLILDEPTSNLDEKSANIIIGIIEELKKEKTIIIATHDKELMTGKIIEFKTI
jgi:putative ABC transport system ATP-binding protein